MAGRIPLVAFIGEILLLLALVAAVFAWCRQAPARLLLLTGRLLLEVVISTATFYLGWRLGEAAGQGLLGSGAGAATLGLLGWWLPGWWWNRSSQRRHWETRLNGWLAGRRRTREWLQLSCWGLGLGTLLLVVDLLVLVTAHGMGGEAFAQRTRLWCHWPGLLAPMPVRDQAARPPVATLAEAQTPAPVSKPLGVKITLPRGPSAHNLVEALQLASDLRGMTPDDIAMILTQMPELNELLQSDSLKPLAESQAVAGAAEKMGAGDISGVAALAGDASMRQVLNDSQLMTQLRQLDFGKMRELARLQKSFQRRVTLRDWRTFASDQLDWQALAADPAATWRQRPGRTGLVAWPRGTLLGIARGVADIPEDGAGEAVITLETPGAAKVTLGDQVLEFKKLGERTVAKAILPAGPLPLELVVDFSQSSALRSAYIEIKIMGQEPERVLPAEALPPPTAP